MSRLLSGSPIIKSGPLLPPFSIPAKVSKLSLPFASLPWQSRQCLTKIGATWLTKCGPLSAPFSLEAPFFAACSVPEPPFRLSSRSRAFSIACRRPAINLRMAATCESVSGRFASLRKVSSRCSASDVFFSASSIASWRTGIWTRVSSLRMAESSLRWAAVSAARAGGNASQHEQRQSDCGERRKSSRHGERRRSSRHGDGRRSSSHFVSLCGRPHVRV